ncbi:MAG: ABC transporter permease [Candidatus Acidiferrales bacterium]
MKSLLRQARESFRKFTGNFKITVGGVLTLALGLGVNAMLFAGRYTSPAQPPVLKGYGHIEKVSAADSRGSGTEAFSYREYLYLRNHNHSFVNLAVAAPEDPVVALLPGREAEPKPVLAQFVSENFFAALGAKPALGHLFAQDRRPAAICNLKAAVVSYAFWQHELGGDPKALGKTVLLNDVRFEIIGVAPKDFSGAGAAFGADLWLGLAAQSKVEPGQNWQAPQAPGGFELLGRLKPGVSEEQARAELLFLSRLYHGIRQDAIHLTLMNYTPPQSPLSAPLKRL